MKKHIILSMLVLSLFLSFCSYAAESTGQPIPQSKIVNYTCPHVRWSANGVVIENTGFVGQGTGTYNYVETKAGYVWAVNGKHLLQCDAEFCTQGPPCRVAEKEVLNAKNCVISGQNTFQCTF
jgi:hypothetical protein